MLNLTPSESEIHLTCDSVCPSMLTYAHMCYTRTHVCSNKAWMRMLIVRAFLVRAKTCLDTSQEGAVEWTMVQPSQNEHLYTLNSGTGVPLLTGIVPDAWLSALWRCLFIVCCQVCVIKDFRERTRDCRYCSGVRSTEDVSDLLFNILFNTLWLF